MAKFKSIYGPTGAVQLPSGKRGYNGLVEVKDEKDITFLEANSNFVKAGKADEKSDDDAPVGLDSLTVPKLKELAEEREIDLGDASNKAEILEAIKAAAE